MRIRYQKGGLTVAFDTRGQKSYQDCFHVSTEGIHLPASYYVGMTAHTGQVADNHDIYSLSVTDLSPENKKGGEGEAAAAPSPAPEAGSKEQSHATKPGEWRRGPAQAATSRLLPLPFSLALGPPRPAAP